MTQVWIKHINSRVDGPGWFHGEKTISSDVTEQKNLSKETKIWYLRHMKRGESLVTLLRMLQIMPVSLTAWAMTQMPIESHDRENYHWGVRPSELYPSLPLNLRQVSHTIYKLKYSDTFRLKWMLWRTLGGPELCVGGLNLVSQGTHQITDDVLTTLSPFVVYVSSYHAAYSMVAGLWVV